MKSVVNKNTHVGAGVGSQLGDSVGGHVGAYLVRSNAWAWGNKTNNCKDMPLVMSNIKALKAIYNVFYNTSYICSIAKALY